MKSVIIKTFLLIFLFFAFLFLGLEIFQAIVLDTVNILSLDFGEKMIQAAYGLSIKMIMFFIFSYFTYLTYSMMDSAIGVWVYKEEVEQEFDEVIERSIEWSFYKALRVLQVPLIFLGVILLFTFMLVNFFNLICAFGGIFISICSFFFSFILMMLAISFIVCSLMLIFNAMFLFWGDDLVVVNPDESNSDVFEISRRFFFMKKSHSSLSVITLLYLLGVIAAMLIFDANKLLVLGASIPIFFVLKYIKSWLLEMSFSSASQSVIMHEEI